VVEAAPLPRQDAVLSAPRAERRSLDEMTTLSADDIRLATPEFWAQPEEEREAAFATLRRDKPVSFHEELAYTEGVPPGPGFWAITRYESTSATCPSRSASSSAR
jgi:hypothetical protein